MLSAFHSTPTSDPLHIHLTPELEEELDEKSKIPFNFLHIPLRLIDEGILAELDGNSVKVLTIITRYVDLREKIIIGKRVLLSGWGIPISYNHIAKKSGLSRRTVIRKVKILVEQEILQVGRVGRCNCYRLTEYAIAIEEVRRAYKEQREAERAESEQKSQSHQESQEATVTEPQTSQEPFVKPGVPTEDQVRAFIREEIVSTVSPIIKELVSTVSPIKETNSKEKTLSDTDTQGKKNSLSILELKQQHPDWEDYRQYAEQFYGEIPSPKLLVTASVYFKGMVSSIGFAPDGVDRLMEMIKDVKAQGAYHHTCFDEQFGVEAFARVKEEESRRLRRQVEEEEMKASSGDTDDDEPSDSSDSISPRPTSAKEAVSGRVYVRWCCANVNIGSPYTDEDIERVWEEEYERFRTPETMEDWIEDRIYLREKLVEKEITEPYTDGEMEELGRRAGELYGE